jgi:methyl-accepting chemotaxis protein
MRVNLPITQNEQVLREGSLIVSTTDLKGRITSINTEFVQVSGFTEQELIGKAHNIVRHPDMPEEAYVDLWRTLQAGRPWTGMVKNRCKNGDYYWVLANVTPLREGETVSGYMSVRTKPSREQIAAAEGVYRLFREKSAGHLAIREGRVVRRSVLDRLALLGRLGLAEVALLVGALALLPALAGVVALLHPALLAAAAVRRGLAVTLGLAALAAAGLSQWHARRLAGGLRETTAQVLELIQGRFNGTLAGRGEDELAEAQRALQSLRTKMGFQIAESRREAALIRNALENASASVMVADENFNIVYANASAQKLFREAETDFRKDVPALQADRVVGSNIDIFHRNPAHQRRVLTELRGTHVADIRIGTRSMRIATTAISDTNGRRLGTVVEWFDRTQEVRAEEEVNAIVRRALAGELDARVGTEGKSGFFAALGKGLNELLHNFSDVMRAIKTAAGEVGRAAEEITAGNANLSRRTEEQSSSLEETAASMEQMTGTVKQNAENAGQASNLATAAREQAEAGGRVVTEAVRAMDEISAAAERIADITGTIDEIAFQTNLLALNAAVEAARAGEQGRGFAVVASEVRSLAGRSAVAAREIKDLIQDSVSKVRDGSAQVTQSGSALQEIMVSIKKVAAIVAEIAGASREQSTGIEQVNTAVMHMDDMTQQNAALVEEATAASQSMAEQARRLNEMMQRYRVGDEVNGATAAGPVTAGRHGAKVPLAVARGSGLTAKSVRA